MKKTDIVFQAEKSRFGVVVRTYRQNEQWALVLFPGKPVPECVVKAGLEVVS